MAITSFIKSLGPLSEAVKGGILAALLNKPIQTQTTPDTSNDINPELVDQNSPADTTDPLYFD